MLSWSSTSTLSQLILASRRISERAKNGQQQQQQQYNDDCLHQEGSYQNLQYPNRGNDDFMRIQLNPSKTQIPKIPDVLLGTKYSFKDTSSDANYVGGYHDIDGSRRIPERRFDDIVLPSTSATNHIQNWQSFQGQGYNDYRQLQQQQQRDQQQIRRHVYLVKGRRSRTQLIPDHSLDRNSGGVYVHHNNTSLCGRGGGGVGVSSSPRRLIYRYSAPETENDLDVLEQDDTNFHKFCTIRIKFIW